VIPGSAGAHRRCAPPPILAVALGSRAGLAVLARGVGQLLSPSGKLGTLALGADAYVRAVVAALVQIAPVGGCRDARGRNIWCLHRSIY
jgi:hypothetical protein